MPLPEAAPALEHVARPAQVLAELAVADDVDPDVDLALDHLCHRASQTILICLLVDLFAILALEEKVGEFGWPDQAADMGGQDSVGGHARFLGCFLPRQVYQP